MDFFENVFNPLDNVIVSSRGQFRIAPSSICSTESGNFICEIYPEEWHTYFPLEKDTLVLGIKEGPYIPYKDIDVLK